MIITKYMMHEFIKTEGGGINRCKMCNLRVSIRFRVYGTYIEECLYLKNDIENTWAKLDLTCNEVLIKNLLE